MFGMQIILTMTSNCIIVSEKTFVALTEFVAFI